MGQNGSATLTLQCWYERFSHITDLETHDRNELIVLFKTTAKIDYNSLYYLSIKDIMEH